MEVETEVVLTQTQGGSGGPDASLGHSALSLSLCLFLPRALVFLFWFGLVLFVFCSFVFHKGLAVKYLGFPGYLISVRIVHLCH